MALHKVFCRHHRVVVLMFLGCGFATELHRLLRTEMYAGQALSAAVAAKGLAVGQADVALWTHLSTNAATNA